MRSARFANAFYTIWEEEEQPNKRGYHNPKMEGRMCEWDG